MSINLQSIVVLLLFIAPGFLYSRAYLNAKPRYQRTPDLFQQTVLAVVGSTLIHVFLVSFIALTVFICTSFLNQELTFGNIFRDKLADSKLRSLAIYSFITTTYITISMALASRLGAWLGSSRPESATFLHRFLRGSYPPEPIMLWYSTLIEDPKKDDVISPRIAVWLRNGECFEGNLIEFRLSAEGANEIELALDDVIFQHSQLSNSKASSKSVAQKRSLPNHRVLLRSADILWLARIDKKNE